MGNRCPWQQVVDALDITGRLQAYNPCVIGTPPLGIDIESSDIDIACYAPDLPAFADTVTQYFGQEQDYTIRTAMISDLPSVVVSFHHAGWPVELFCQSRPTAEQWGVRHFIVEQRLLSLVPALRDDIRILKQAGWKTEPAFARLLNLAGDPYHAMLLLEQEPDARLLGRIKRRLDARQIAVHHPQ